jgi:DNA-binding MarR family transcriptional regulator
MRTGGRTRSGRGMTNLNRHQCEVAMSTNRTLRAVPTPATDPAKPRTETEEKLWQALRNNPGSTATALSTTAGIGKSTAPKILTRWEKDGLVTRTAGIADGGSRPADRWSITTDNQLTDDQPTDDQRTGDQPTDDDPGKQSEKSQRLAPGALRGMVEDYLRDNSGAFSPNAIGKGLNRSSGAVHNALEKLVASGYAVRTSDKPKKYSLAATTAATTE